MKPYSYTIVIETKKDFDFKTFFRDNLELILNKFNIYIEYKGKYKISREKYYLTIEIPDEINIIEFYSELKTILDTLNIIGLQLILADGSLSYKKTREMELKRSQEVADNRRRLEEERERIKLEKRRVKQEKDRERYRKMKEKIDNKKLTKLEGKK